jgi:hypothetical protein
VTGTRPPLSGIRVVESSLLGPAAVTTHLADMGAEVIKVESPAGDYVREMTWPIIQGVSLLHLHINRGKKSLTLDLKRPEAVEIYKDLARTTRISRGAPTSSSRRCAPARWRDAAWATRTSVASTRGSSSATSPATG